MTAYRLFRVTLKTKGGLAVFACMPERPGSPITWTQRPELADRWMPATALDVLCSLRRANKPARLERCDETIRD